jgi:hypothetical protein
VYKQGVRVCIRCIEVKCIGRTKQHSRSILFLKERDQIAPHNTERSVHILSFFTSFPSTITMVATRSAIKHQAQVDSSKNASKPKSSTTKFTKAKDSNSTSKLDNHKITTEVKQKMNELLSKLTSSSSTICPSQIARGLNKDYPARFPDWRAMMDPVRNIVWEEVMKGTVEVTQGGEVRTLEEREGLKGPIRVRRGEKWNSG